MHAPDDDVTFEEQRVTDEDSRLDDDHALAEVKTDDDLPYILNLPTEILTAIFKLCVRVSSSPSTIDQRSSLSVQSRLSDWDLPMVNGGLLSKIDIKDWSEVCVQFAKIAYPYEFKRIAIRCSEEGLARLRAIIRDPEKVNHVRKLSYMVYGSSSLDSQQFELHLSEIRSKKAVLVRELEKKSTSQLRTKLALNIDYERSIINMMNRSVEQRRIKNERRDEMAIISALEAFGKKLEQVRLMRVVDEIELGWENFARSVPGMDEESRSSRWAAACEHAAVTLARAFHITGCRPSRISSRASVPHTSLRLTSNLQRVPSFALPVRCLELQFDDRANLDEEMLELSELFQRGFNAAVNVQGLHIGFTRPVSIPFQSVFHDVHWPSLKHIGFGAWRVSSDDIIGFARRHRQTLTSIRLRGVLLKDGSRWEDVLRVFRLELTLRWVSFRGVGYTDQETPEAIMIYHDHEYDSDESEPYPESGSQISSETPPTNGENGIEEAGGGTQDDAAHVTDEPPDDLVSDDERSSNDFQLSQSQDGAVGGEDDLSSTPEPIEPADDDGDMDSLPGLSEFGLEPGMAGAFYGSYMSHQSEAGDSDHIGVNDFAIDDQEMLRHTTSVPNNPLGCKCGSGFAWEDRKDDNRVTPSKQLWKNWQEWVVKRCPTHDQIAAQTGA